MRVAILFAAVLTAAAQPADRAYTALRARDYDTAIAQFQAAIAVDPRSPAIRKDLAYTYLKVGEPALARDQFHAAATLDSTDITAALEYAYLCFETKQQAEARRTFGRLRHAANATPAQREAADKAFHNIDDPLAVAIDRWQQAIALGADNVSAHSELAAIAEQRDDLALAATHYERAWRLLPERRGVLLDLGRVWRAQGRSAEASAALLAASRGGEARTAELAREQLPAHYPYVPEFRAALVLDPANHELRREFAFLLLRMNREPEAERELRILTQNAPNDLLSITQLAFLLYARGERLAAQPLFDRVLAGNDEELANRVRAVLRVPQLIKLRDKKPASIDAKIMAERSIKAGYIKDALRYLETAHEADPADFDVMLQLAWTNNILHRDALAFRWFDLARNSPDPKIAAEAQRGFRNLRAASRRYNLTGWLYPMFSTRWHDVFGYGQLKTELNLKTWFHPYVSSRLIGDVQQAPNLSERSIIFALGIATRPWRGFTFWGEAGAAVSYVKLTAAPDYRGGMAYAKALRAHRWFASTTADAVYISRFSNDFIGYAQNKAGYGPLYWNLNLTADARRQDWANLVETGPGIRVPMAESLYLTFNALRGRYLLNLPNRKTDFNDFRAGFWYAFTR